METVGWLLIPLAATLLGILWVVWRSRDPKPVDAEESMETMARFREAMEKPLPPLERRPPASDDPYGDDPGAYGGTHGEHA